MILEKTCIYNKSSRLIVPTGKPAVSLTLKI